MLRLIAPLFGFAVFGALFAGLYYDDPTLVERASERPKYRLAPEAVRPDFIEPVTAGENVTVQIRVVSGGPIDVYLMDMENLSLTVLNLTSPGFDLQANPFAFNESYTRFGVNESYDFTFVADGENRYAVVLRSGIPVPGDYENLTEDEREPYVTEVAVTMRYVDREEQSLLFGYIMAAPSLVLVILTFWLKGRRRSSEGQGSGLVKPRDQGLD